VIWIIKLINDEMARPMGIVDAYLIDEIDKMAAVTEGRGTRTTSYNRKTGSLTTSTCSPCVQKKKRTGRIAVE
jgi:hypothetical protein